MNTTTLLDDLYATARCIIKLRERTKGTENSRVDAKLKAALDEIDDAIELEESPQDQPLPLSNDCARKC